MSLPWPDWTTEEWVARVEAYQRRRRATKGGPGSGHFGHEGRPGQIGGSAPSTGTGTVETRTRADVESSPEFRRWFGESKVVDDNGDPLVVYHGTSQDVTQFDPQRAMTGNVHSLYLNVPMYFATDSPIVAGSYAFAEGANVLPLYMRIERPLDIDARGNDFTYAYEKVSDELPIYRNDTAEQFAEYRDSLMARFTEEEWQFNELSTLLKPAELTRLNALQQAADADRTEDYRVGKKYDGIIIRNVIDQASFEEGVQWSTVYVTFKPTQIKSAIGNRGTFDPKNPDITRATKGGPGSGNFGHAGRPGEVGGSAPSGDTRPSAAPSTTATPPNTADAERRIAMVTRRAQEVADRMGINPARITVVDEAPRSFTVGEQQFKEAAHYNPTTGEIRINAQNSYDDRMSVTNGIVAHEISHAVYDAARVAQKAEHDEIARLSDEEYDRFFQANGYVRPELQADVHDRYPVSAMFYRHLGDAFMETEAEQGRFAERARALEHDDGITPYSGAHWHPSALKQAGGFERAMNETLAEIARRRVVFESFEGGTPTERWRLFSDDLLRLATQGPVSQALREPRKSV